MKKLLALLLSVMMAASLAVPAFADGPDGPAPDGYDGQVEAVPISAILDESIGVIGGADGPTSILISGPLGAMDWEDYLNLLEETTVEDWVKLLEQQAQAQRDELKKTLGGVPGQIGVMVNGAYIQFPDAAPEVTDGRTMVPVRALVEALGGEVDYEFADQKDSVRLFIDKYTINFTVGGTTAVRHTRGSDTGEADKTIEMDCAPYIKGGRTYVPVRFIAEALGYDVGWDGEYETAILVNRAALAEQYDEHFTIMNKVQANRVAGWEKGKTLSSDVKGSVTVTAFDTLNGNKTYKADFTSRALMNTEAISGAYSFKMSDNIVDLLVGQYAGSMDEEVLERMRLVLDALEDAEIIMTKDGLAWVHSPALDELGGEKDIWCGMEMDADEVQTAFASADASTIGAALAAMVSTDSVIMSSQAGAVSSIMELYMDEKFTTSGGVSTLTIGLEDLGKVYGTITGETAFIEDYLDVFEVYEITMKVDSKGGATVTLEMETAAQTGMPGVKMSMKSTQTGGKAELTMDVHVANMGEMKLVMNTEQKTVSDKPMSEPPEDATVVDAPELLEP